MESIVKIAQNQIEEEMLIEKDAFQTKKLYPRFLKYVNMLVEDALNRYEYEGSSMFFEVLDPYFLYRVEDEVEKAFDMDVDYNEMKGYVKLLILDEVQYRRMRYMLRMRRFDIICR